MFQIWKPQLYHDFWVNQPISETTEPTSRTPPDRSPRAKVDCREDWRRFLGDTDLALAGISTGNSMMFGCQVSWFCHGFAMVLPCFPLESGDMFTTKGHFIGQWVTYWLIPQTWSLDPPSFRLPGAGQRGQLHLETQPFCHFARFFSLKFSDGPGKCMKMHENLHENMSKCGNPCSRMFQDFASGNADWWFSRIWVIWTGPR